MKEKKIKRMKLSNNLLVNLSLEKVWKFFDDTDSFAKTVPTLKEYTLINETEFKGKVGITLGKIPIRSRLDFEITEKVHQEKICGKGVSYLGESIVNMKKSKNESGEITKKSCGKLDIILKLASDGEGRTLVQFSADIVAEGRLRKIYQSIINTKIPTLKQEFVDNLRKTLQVQIDQLPEIDAETGEVIPEPPKKRRFFRRMVTQEA